METMANNTVLYTGTLITMLILSVLATLINNCNYVK